jgi:CheY-like chemotaxis protein/anti-sigma regulatory factor (Ser/Thr protein kinase)
LKRVDVDALVEQAIESNRGFAETYGARLSFTANCAPDYVRADYDRLFQVITNLLSNAIKFSPWDGEVVVAVENRNDIVRISVRDKGPGIPADFKPHMFEKFAQADSSDARQKGGTGLGLSIVKGIVLRLGGEVSFDSVPGCTVFHVDLPRFAHVEGESARSHVLHVHSDSDVRDAVTQVLAPIADVVSVDSLDEARCVLASKHFDLAIVDIALPVGSGLDLLPALRNSEGETIPVVIFSTQNADLARDAQVPVTAAKPRDAMDRLLATVRDRLARQPSRVA